MVKLISSSRIIAENIEDLNLDVSEYIDRVYTWIENAVATIGCIKAYPLTHKILDIKEGITELPCDLKYVHSAWIRTNQCSDGSGIGYLSLTNSPFIGKDLVSHTKTGNMGNLDGNYLYTDIKEGNLLLVYRRIPKDKKGFPMIPDNPILFEALNYYIIYRLGFRGIKHPLISFEMAMQKWEQLYPRASNSIDWFTLPELESFTRMWSIILSGHITDNLYIN